MGNTIRIRGSYDKTYAWLNRLQQMDLTALLKPYGDQGVNALIANTPHDSGIAAESWYWKVVKKPNGIALEWHNRDIENGFPVAIMLQYGYSTGTGGYVHGRDYINPAMRPIFDQIARGIEKAVRSV